jgi:hypothetical protein
VLRPCAVLLPTLQRAAHGQADLGFGAGGEERRWMMYFGGGCECDGLERRGQLGVGVKREVDVCRESEEVVTAR